MELQQGVLFIQMPSAILDRKQERQFFGNENLVRWKQMCEDDIFIPFQLIWLLFNLVYMLFLTTDLNVDFVLSLSAKRVLISVLEPFQNQDESILHHSSLKFWWSDYLM